MFSNEDLNDIIKNKSLEESRLLIQDANETVENKVRQQKEGFLGNISCYISASLLGNMLAGKCVIRAGEVTNTKGQDF